MTEDQIRAAFEKWAEREGRIHYEFDIAWSAFRAAFSIAIPDGWKVVPVEHTHKMGLAGNSDLPSDVDCSIVWAAMLNAAPQPDYTK